MTSALPRTTLFLALAALALPLHATDADADAEVRNPTRLATIHVEAADTTGFHADNSQLDTFGSFGNAPLIDTPAAISVITRDLIDARQPRTLSELARNDAALGDSYAPVGYYQNLAIRGFPLDLATGYRMNELALVGEQPIALEDKERVEVLKGLGGLEAGVVSPGGLVNYVSKRPAEVRRATLGSDSHGSRYLALDLGTWLTPAFGLRLNAAHEGTHAFVEHADGNRNFLALAADWKLGADATLRFDGNYQASSQRSVSGYQLLGGTTLPRQVDVRRMLGFQAWQRPVGVDAANLTLRYDQRLAETWALELAAGHSRAVIDDNVAFAYGCFYAPACADGDAPGWFFAPDGDYDIYDFRSPDDTRVNDEARAVLKGAFDTGALTHELVLGATAFRRTIDSRPYVYDYVGTGNIHDAAPPLFAPSPAEPGPSVRRLTSWQRAVFALDRIHLGDTWQLLAGARRLRLDERAWTSAGLPERHTRLERNLPQAALLWQPAPRLSTYLSYSESLALGHEAPFWASNSDVTLGPLLARQAELGARLQWSERMNLGAALYRLRQPWQFAQPDQTPEGFTFVQRGQEVHEGLELNAAGELVPGLSVNASVNWIRARGQDSGTPAYEGHQVINVPRLRTALFLDWRVPALPALHLGGGWRSASASVATPDGQHRAPGWTVFDASLGLEQAIGRQRIHWRLGIDNVFDRFYWRDTGSSGGDGYLFPGQPRLARLSASLDF